MQKPSDKAAAARARAQERAAEGDPVFERVETAEGSGLALVGFVGGGRPAEVGLDTLRRDGLAERRQDAIEIPPEWEGVQVMRPNDSPRQTHLPREKQAQLAAALARGVEAEEIEDDEDGDDYRSPYEDLV